MKLEVELEIMVLVVMVCVSHCLLVVLTSQSCGRPYSPTERIYFICRDQVAINSENNTAVEIATTIRVITIPVLNIRIIACFQLSNYL